MSNGSRTDNPGFREMNLTIPANQMRPVHAPFNCLFIYGITGSGVTLKMGDGGQESDQNITAGRKYTLPDGQVFGRLEFYNSSAGAAQVNFGLALGDIDDKRMQFVGAALAVSQAAAASNFSYGFKIDVQTTQSIAANSNRKGLDIRNVGSAPLFASNGPSTGAGGDDSHGFRINPGEVFTPLTTGQISFRNNTSLAAGTQLYSFVEYG